MEGVTEMVLKDKRGTSHVPICVFILIIMMSFSVILVYSSAITSVRLQKTNTETVFDSFVAQNSILIYSNIKQGRNATDHLNTAPFYTMLKSFCTLEEKGGMYYSYDDDGAEKFHMTKPKMEFIEEDTLELYVTFTMYVPIRFAGKTVSTAEVPVKVSSALTSKNE